MNPEMEIYFLFATKKDFISMKYSDLIDALLTYPNVNLRFLNPLEYSRGTILEDFFIHKSLENSSFPLEHTSDVLRMLTMHKYGGVYLDLDVICLLSFKMISWQAEINKNFACTQETNDVSNAIVKINAISGKEVTEAYLE
jgi:lactosylceramide 4-alpha-galactosyltransferase